MRYIRSYSQLTGLMLKSRTSVGDLFFICFLIATFKGFNGVNGEASPIFSRLNPSSSTRSDHFLRKYYYESQSAPLTNPKNQPSHLINGLRSGTRYPALLPRKTDQLPRSVYELDKKQNVSPSYFTLNSSKVRNKFSSWLLYQNSLNRKSYENYDRLKQIPNERIFSMKRKHNLKEFFPTLKIEISKNFPTQIVAENAKRLNQSELTLKSLNKKKDLNEILGYPSVEWACGPYASGEIRKILFSDITERDVNYIKGVAQGDEGNFMNAIVVCCQRRDPFECEGNDKLKRLLIAGLFLHFNFGEDS